MQKVVSKLKYVTHQTYYVDFLVYQCILRLSFVLLGIFPGCLAAKDLIDAYQLAICNDPTIQAAREARLAAFEAYPQARALFLPVVAATATNTYYNKNYDGNTITFLNQTIPLTIKHFHYDQSVYSLQLTQPVFYYQQWVQLSKADDQVKQANAVYAASEQDLIVRTVQRYFGVLRAIDNLKYAKTQRVALEKFLKQAEAEFKAGVITITDSQITKARYDSALSQEIAAENNVEIQKQLLIEITGEPICSFSELQQNLNLKSPEPQNIEEWVCRALEQNYNLRAARYQAEAAKQDILLNQSGHLPTININGQVIQSGPTRDIVAYPRNTNSYIGLQVAMPLFSGGSVVSKTRQARHLYGQAESQMEAICRQVRSATRQAYLNVLTQISQIKAFKQSVASNQIALKSTDTAFKTGTRTIVDLLNSQTDVIKSEQDFMNAQYDYILQSVLLKQAAGTLSPEDVCLINTWLVSRK